MSGGSQTLRQIRLRLMHLRKKKPSVLEIIFTSIRYVIVYTIVGSELYDNLGVKGQLEGDRERMI